jgi:hypothetical protein
VEADALICLNRGIIALALSCGTVRLMKTLTAIFFSFEKDCS